MAEWFILNHTTNHLQQFLNILIFRFIIMIDFKKIKVEISNRHIHLKPKHVDTLFGEGYELKVHKELSQPGQFSSFEKVTLVNGLKKINNVRILGPPRNETQIEISRTDSFFLKLNPPVRLSGDLEESPGIIILGPKGKIEINKGVIIAHRHLHLSHEEAEKLKIMHGQIIKIKVPGIKETIFNNVIARVQPKYRLAFHIDRDEGNACFLEPGTFAELIME